MIFLAFLLPISIYLFVLGALNRQPRPVPVSGVTDFIGVLFAASGFLLFGGPAILSGLNDRWRLFWLSGQRPGGSDGFRQVWVFLSALYYFVVVGGAALVLRNRRHVTAIYNVEPEVLDQCLVQVCEHLGRDPVRCGNTFVFGVASAARVTAPGGDGIQAAPAAKTLSPSGEPFAPSAVLEVEPFARMRHVTLRWEPADSVARREVEAALQKVLAETPVEPSELGAWLTMLGVTLFGLTVIGGVTLLVIRLFT